MDRESEKHIIGEKYWFVKKGACGNRDINLKIIV